MRVVRVCRAPRPVSLPLVVHNGNAIRRVDEGTVALVLDEQTFGQDASTLTLLLLPSGVVGWVKSAYLEALT